MEIKENKSNMIFYPDGSEIKNNNNDSDRMRLSEMADLIKVFGDSRSSEVPRSVSDCYGPLEKKQRKNRKHYSTRETAHTALKISIATLSISISTLVALAIEKIKK